MLRTARIAALAALACFAALVAAQTSPPATTASQAATRDTSFIDSEGTAHVTRVVPVPKDLSLEAQKSLATVETDDDPPESPAENRKEEEHLIRLRQAWSKLCPNTVADGAIAGVPVRIVTPEGMPESNRDKVLINLHGGGFVSDNGSYTETIPMAGYSKIKVVSVLYRLAPDHPFPAAIEDAVAVYKELLRTYNPAHIAVYGSSAGATLTAEFAAKVKQLGLPMPGALGIFSGLDSFDRNGDSISIYSGDGLSGHLDPPHAGTRNPWYAGKADPKDPTLSPIYGDPHGFPPTLFVTSTRDMLLSGTVNLHRAYLNAGVDAHLVVFDALPHVFWDDPELPESIEASHFMADFMVKALTQH